MPGQKRKRKRKNKYSKCWDCDVEQFKTCPYILLGKQLDGMRFTFDWFKADSRYDYEKIPVLIRCPRFKKARDLQ